jgi:hypothetical protein
VTEVALTRGREDSVGAAAMLPIAACSDVSGWTRRQGVRREARPRSRRRGNGEGEKRGRRGGDVHFNRDQQRGIEEGKAWGGDT